MIKENELVVFLQGIILLLFFLSGGIRIRQLSKWRIFLLSYGFLSAGWLFTIVEGFVFPYTCNFLEHLCYTAGSIVLALWCWLTFRRKKEKVK